MTDTAAVTEADITEETKISINHVSRDDLSNVHIVRMIDGKRRYKRIGAIYSKTKREYSAEHSRLIVTGEEADDPAVAQVKQELSYFYTEVLFKEYRFFAGAGLPANIIDRLNDTERAKITREVDRLNRRHQSILSQLLKDGFEVREKHSDDKRWINATMITGRIAELKKSKKNTKSSD